MKATAGQSATVIGHILACRLSQNNDQGVSRAINRINRGVGIGG
jgi:hypothetical protein